MFNTVRIPPFHLQITAKKHKVTVFPTQKIRVFSKEVCYKVSFCDNFQQERCKAFTGLSTRAQMVGGNFQSIFTRVVKLRSKIRSSIYKFEFKFSFLAFTIRSVIVPQGRAFNKLHNCIVRISNAWLRALHRRPAR